MSPDYVSVARQYCDDVQTGVIPACKWVRLATQRHLDDLAREDTPSFRYHFDHRLAEKICGFVERLPHIKGPLANQLIRLEPYQVWMLTTLFGWVNSAGKKVGKRRYRRAHVELPRGSGKAEWIENLIPTPSGMKRMADLLPGDLVFGSDGHPVTVVATTEVMHDRDCMEVEFATGEKIVVAADHLWEVQARYSAVSLRKPWTADEDGTLVEAYTNGGGNAAALALPHRSRHALFKRAAEIGASTNGRKYQEYRKLECPRKMTQHTASTVISTKDIAASLTFGIRQDNRYFVDMSPAVETPEAEFLVPPYTLGAWLGDGSSNISHITSAFDDIDIIDQIRKEGVTAELRQSTDTTGLYILGRNITKCRASSLQSKLRSIGVLNNKHIPVEYKTSSYAQRVELLRGLMDTDGHATKSGSCEFYNTNLSLARDVHELVCSLGIRAFFREKDAKIDGRFISKCYTVTFFPIGFVPFHLARKVARIKPFQDKRLLSRAIVAIRPVPSVPVKCIQVANPDGIYLTSRSYIRTHNSLISSALSLYMLSADGEGGSDCFSAATTRDQARIVFDTARAMARSKEAKKMMDHLGVDVNAHTITVAKANSRLMPLSAEANSLEGLSVHYCSVDETHAHKTRDVWDSIVLGAGKRDQSLVFGITTAGYDLTGIGYELHTYLCQVLEGVIHDETQFGCIWSIDEDDDWQDPTSWRKANPGLGVSVDEDYFGAIAKEAIAVPSKQAGFKTKYLNLWLSNYNQWADMVAWKNCVNPDINIEDFVGLPCYMGLDLGAKCDLAAKALVFEDEGHYAAFVTYYLPESAVTDGRNASYKGWVIDGLIKTTEGNILDYEAIEQDIEDDMRKFDVAEIAIDPWEATALTQRLIGKGAKVVEVMQTVSHLSEPTKELDALTRAGKFHYNDPILMWCASNVVVREDTNDNIKPNKVSPGQKIDGVIAVILALCRHLVNQETSSVYDRRGVLTIGG